MASAVTAMGRTDRHEGEWANNPNDRGKETYRGIARGPHPRWKGWPIIDQEKKKLGSQPPYGTKTYRVWVEKLNTALRRLPLLQRHVFDFFKEVFWDRNKLDEIVDQDLANWLYDMAVNTWDDGNRAAQRAVGVEPDGELGPVSVAALNAADPREIIRKATAEMVEHYKKEARKPGQLEHLPGWLARLGIPKDERAAIVASIAKEVGHVA